MLNLTSASPSFSSREGGGGEPHEDFGSVRPWILRRTDFGHNDPLMHELKLKIVKLSPIS